MSLFRFLVAALVAALAFAEGPAPGSEPPKLQGETLDGKQVSLPEAAAGKVTLLLIGASKKGGDLCGPWKEHFIADFGANPNATYYVAALLQSAPGFVRGMIRSSMRGGTPGVQRSHVLTSNSEEAAWKNYLKLTNDSVPGVLLLDGSGHTLWSYNGGFDPEHYRELKAASTAALEHRTGP